MQDLINEIKRNSQSLGQNSKRLFHGRGKCFEGFENIVIDWFAPIILVDCFGQVKNLDHILKIIQTIFLEKELKSLSLKSIIYRNRKEKPIKTHAYIGSIPEKHFACWNGLKFEIDFRQNQNIGYFLDAENIRKYLSMHAKDKNILNLFAYTCSLSVVAKRYGAKSITNIDMKKSFLKIGQKNHFHSNLNTKDVAFLPYNIMKSLSQLQKKNPWDIVIIDPPSSQGKHFEIKRDYQKIIKIVSKLRATNGTIILCINSPFITSHFIIDLCQKYIPNFTLKEILYSPSSFVEKENENGIKIVIL